MQNRSKEPRERKIAPATAAEEVTDERVVCEGSGE
jgi:hypothetical protein